MEQTTKMQHWTDETGQIIPIGRITDLERFKERNAIKLVKESTKVSNAIAELKELVKNVCNDVYERHMKQSNVQPDKQGKGNYTWWNFDRTIKITVKINEQIAFDDLTIAAAKIKFDEFLENTIVAKDDFVKEMVSSAFEARGGKLDVKQVLSLIKYKSKVKNELFQEAIKLLEESIRRPKSKTYFQIWTKDDAGEYQLINLDFASL
jgi:hypothetical protein